MARLQEQLETLSTIERLNEEKQASIAAKLQQYLAQAKVEVLDTTLTEWRSLRQEPGLELPEAIAPSDVAELTSLIENYPAQKVIEYAMAEFNQAREQSLEMNTSSLDKVPKPITNSPPKPKPKQSTAPPGQTASPPKPKTRTPRNPTPKPVKPVAIAAFWQPDYATAQRPEQIELHHWEEMTRSAIHPDFITLNTESVSGEAVYERLLSERLAQLGTGQYVTQPMARLMDQYETLTEGGWWGNAGIDAKSLLNLEPGQPQQLSTWGVFKADNPRIDQEKSDRSGETEYKKYENPLGVSRSLYLPVVPDSLAERIYEKHGIEPSEAERQSGFWSVVANHPEIPIVVTEGLKKTLSSLSQGEVTLGLAGVNALYRARDDDKEKLPERVLNAEVAIFATPGRSFTFAFDSDAKTSTVFNVRAELVRGVELLEDRGSAVKVAKWKPELGKGLDDLIVNQGPTAYAVALAKAEAAEREKRIYYRTQYNALAREIRKKKPGISGEALDIEVYLLAIAKGEMKDGDRFLSQSDHARTLKDPQQVAAYIEHIKASAPQYLQQQQALEIARNQDQKDRTIYEGLAQSITAEMGTLKPGPLDIEVCIRLTLDNPNLERILAQSDWAKSRETPEDKTRYIQSIQTAALLTLQKRQTAQDRAEYETLAARIRTSPVQQSSEVVDMQVYLSAEQEGNPGDGDRLIAQSDHARSLNDPDQAQAYVDHIKTQAPQYAQQQRELEAAQAAAQAQQQELERAQAAAQAQRQKELADAQAAAQAKAQRQRELESAAQAAAQAKALAQQPVIDRANYEKLAQQVRNQLINIPPQQFDAVIYKWAQAKGLDGDRTLAQSNTALTFKYPAQLSSYLRQVKTLANRLQLEPGSDVSDQQRHLNIRAVDSCLWLARNHGKQQADGWRVFEDNQFSYHSKDGEYKIYSRAQRRMVLEYGNNRLVSTLSSKDVEKLESAVEEGKEMEEQKKIDAYEKALEKKKNRKSKGRKPRP